MPTVTQIRAGLATNLATISGLRTSALIPDAPQPPIAVVIPNSISYDTTFHRGFDTYSYTITLIVGRQSDRTAQNTLDGFCNPSGATSVKTAIESDRTLGSIAQSLRVTDMASYGSMTIADTVYLIADFSVTVYA
jgi:hypothetical protein